MDEKGRLKIDEATHAVGGDGGDGSAGGVFAGGDFVTGPASVADAVNAGHEAARAINKYLMGDAAALRGEDATGGPAGEAAVCTIGQGFSSSCLQPSGRVEVPALSLSERLRSLTVEETAPSTSLRSRPRPTAASTAAAWRSTRRIWRLR